MGWVGLDWAGLGWIVGFDWIGLGWVGLGWAGLGSIGLDLVGLAWVGYKTVRTKTKRSPINNKLWISFSPVRSDVHAGNQPTLYTVKNACRKKNALLIAPIIMADATHFQCMLP